MRLKKANARHLQGQAGVFAVCEQLCMRGHTPFLPSVDFGVDIMLDNGLKIQVKTGILRMTHPGFSGGVYVFDVRKTCRFRRGGLGIITHDATRNYADIADFVIFLGIDERRFFVLPSEEANGAFWICKRGSRIFQRTTTNAAKILQYEEAWDLLDVQAAIENLEAVETTEEVKL